MLSLPESIPFFRMKKRKITIASEMLLRHQWWKKHNRVWANRLEEEKRMKERTKRGIKSLLVSNSELTMPHLFQVHFIKCSLFSHSFQWFYTLRIFTFFFLLISLKKSVPYVFNPFLFISKTSTKSYESHLKVGWENGAGRK